MNHLYVGRSKSKVARALTGVQITRMDKSPYGNNENDHIIHTVPVDGGGSPNEAHEIHRGKWLEVRLSLALRTIQVTVRISSVKFSEGTIDGDTTYVHLHNFAMRLEGREIFSSPLHS
ncbi:hypothetical protein TNCV_671461 [Trichonephila clavipes]|nr:hypothetical protein TNCV_671461 [Trichonephila clavipes]